MPTHQELLDALQDRSAGIEQWNATPLEERIAAGPWTKTSLVGLDLRTADLGGINWTGSDFSGANLQKCWIVEADLSHCWFVEADLTEVWAVRSKFVAANLSSAKLTGANLRGCDFRTATFASARLSKATLDHADLRGAMVQTESVSDASLRHAQYDAATVFPRTFSPQDVLDWTDEGPAPLRFDVFVKRLGQMVDPGRLSRAVEMLKTEKVQLFSRVEDSSIGGIVRSQTEEGKVYSCHITRDGEYACCGQDLVQCLGLRDALCKHILVLLIGLSRAKLVNPRRLEDWVRASKRRKVTFDQDRLSEALLQYQSAQKGDLDWRPMETIPEDYFAL